MIHSFNKELAVFFKENLQLQIHLQNTRPCILNYHNQSSEELTKLKRYGQVALITYHEPQDYIQL